MKYPYLPLLCIAAVFASCTSEKQTEILQNSTVQASLDFAKVNETGDSKLTYNSKTKENVIVYTDWYVMDMQVSGSRNNSALREDDPKPAAGATGDRISLRYGLEYIGKGAKFPGTGSDLSINLNYLAVPLDVIYHHPAGPGQIEAGLGPYFAYGLSGSSGGISSFGQDNGGFKRFDAGLNLQAGYQLDNGLSFRLGYDLGLSNVEYANEDVKGHTRAFSINIGYQIGRLFAKK
jgi:hypothetical protein